MVIEMSSAAKQTVTTEQAARRFLNHVVGIVDKTYPVWERRLSAFLDDTPMDIEERRNLLEVHPTRHYYFASVVGIEAAKIRSLFQPAIAEDLLADINEIVDEVAERSDHLVSDLVFDIIHRVKISDADETKKAHDIALKRINDLLHLTATEATKGMTEDIVFRQELAQPIAASICHWWNAFKNTQQLEQTIPAPPHKQNTVVDGPGTFKIAVTQ